MNNEKLTLCLKVNRRSALAIVIMFVAASCNDLMFTFGTVGFIVASYYYLPAHTIHLEQQIDSFQETLQLLQNEFASTQRELCDLQKIKNSVLVGEESVSSLCEQEAIRRDSIDNWTG